MKKIINSAANRPRRIDWIGKPGIDPCAVVLLVSDEVEEADDGVETVLADGNGGRSEAIKFTV